MRNAKKTLSLVMVAIFTTFIVLSGLPTAAATISAGAKSQTSRATYYVEKAENVAISYSVTVAHNQYMVAVKEARALHAFGASVQAAYAKLSARLVKLNKAIAMRGAGSSADLVAAEKLVDAAENLTNTDTYDLVGSETDLANAQNAVTDALEGIVKLDKDSAGYKGLMARVDAANAKIISAMDTIQANADVAAQVKAVTDATAAVVAIETAGFASAADATAASALIAAVDDAAVVKDLTDRLAVVVAAPKIVTVSAVDGTISVTFDKASRSALALSDFAVNESINGAASTSVTPSAITTNGAVASISVPVVAPISTEQSVVYSVTYGTTTTSAVAYKVAALPAVMVASASASIPSEITVAFNQKVDPTTAIVAANYSLNGVALDSTATVALQADGKTVVITAGTTGGFKTTTLVTNVGYIVSVTGVESLDMLRTASAAVSPAFTYVADTTAPTLVSATANALTSTTTVTATFNEPVQGVGYYTIGGVAVAAGYNTIPSKTVTLTLGTAIVPGTVYTLQVINEKDAAGNLNSPNPASITFTVALSNSAPTVKVATVGDNTINLTFSSKMDSTTILGLLGTNIKMLDGNLNDARVSLTFGAAVAATSADTTGTLWTITLSGAPAWSSANQLPMTLVFTTALKDSLGNAMVATSVPVVVTKDVVAPVILSAKYIKAGTNYNSLPYADGAIVLTFNKVLNATAPHIASGSVTLINDLGLDESAKILNNTQAVFGATNDIVVIPLDHASPSLTATTLETLRIAASVFTDASIAANKNAAQVITANVASPIADAASSDTTLPVVTIGTATNNVIAVTITDNVGLDFSTVTNVNNYRLNGGLLPTGTYITYAGTTASLHLPAGSIAATTTYRVDVIGIKDAAGNMAANAVAPAVALVDNTKPTMTSLVINGDGTVTVGFSEALSSIAALTATDLTISQTIGTSTPVASLVAAGADKGKILLSGMTLTSGTVLTVTVAGTATAADADGNVVNTGTALSVTK